MKTRIAWIAISFVLAYCTIPAQAQYRYAERTTAANFLLTGNLLQDLRLTTGTAFTGPEGADPKAAAHRYSPLRAGVYSLVIPGAGQLYTHSYWQSAAFLGAETLLWVMYAMNEKRGDNATADFELYANQHWSVVRYALWMQNYYAAKYNDHNSPAILASNDAGISQPWLYVNSWDQLNSCEQDIGVVAATGFSHRLERYGQQQYYEMIGKYAQFIGGWDDAWRQNADGTWTPVLTPDDVVPTAHPTQPNYPPHFDAYSQMRGRADNFYNIASTFSYILVANHVLGALEAAWNASRINHQVHLQGHIQSRILPGGLVEFVPTLECTLDF